MVVHVCVCDLLDNGQQPLWHRGSFGKAAEGKVGGEGKSRKTDDLLMK